MFTLLFWLSKTFSADLPGVLSVTTISTEPQHRYKNQHLFALGNRWNVCRSIFFPLLLFLAPNSFVKLLTCSFIIRAKLRATGPRDENQLMDRTFLRANITSVHMGSKQIYYLSNQSVWCDEKPNMRARNKYVYSRGRRLKKNLKNEGLCL